MAGHGKSRRASKAENRTAAKAKAAATARRHHSRLNVDPEESTRLLLMAAVVGVVALALGIIGFGYWYSVIKPRNRTVLQVDSVKVSYSAMKRRMAYELFQSGGSQQLAQVLGDTVTQALKQEIIIDLKAESDQGISVTDEELNQKLNSALGLGSPTDSKAFADALKKQLASTGLTDAEFRRKVRVELLTTKLNAKFTSEVPASVMQAKFDVILTQTEADAQAAADRVNAGEDWATVAKEVSKEANVATTGGVHNYAPEAALDPTYATEVFSSNIGAVVGPLAAANGTFFVIRVEDRSEQPVNDTQKQQLAQKAFNDWITKMEGELTIKLDFDVQSQNDAINSILPGVIAKLQEQAAQQQQQPQVPPTGVDQATVASQPPPTAAAGEQSPAPAAPTPGGGNGQ
jgi:hypothetical protein